MTSERRAPQVIGHLRRCTLGYSAYTVLVPSAVNGIGIRCQTARARLHVRHLPPAVCMFADSSARDVPVAPWQVLQASGKCLGQVEVTEVSRKADEARAKQTVEGITTLKRGN